MFSLKLHGPIAATMNRFLVCDKAIVIFLTNVFNYWKNGRPIIIIRFMQTVLDVHSSMISLMFFETGTDYDPK